VKEGITGLIGVLDHNGPGNFQYIISGAVLAENTFKQYRKLLLSPHLWMQGVNGFVFVFDTDTIDGRCARQGRRSPEIERMGLP